MTQRWGPLALAVLLAGAPAGAQHGTEPRTAKTAPSRLTDAEAAELAKQALGSSDPTSMRATLVRLNAHTFKSSKIPEREVVLYAQGILESRLGNPRAASVALKKLERQWPNSPFTAEAQPLLAEEAISQKKFKDAETRLHRALAADIPAEQKRKSQELLLWVLVQQGRPMEGLPIVQSLKPLGSQDRPSERGLAAITEVLCLAGEREQAEGARKSFHTLFPRSEFTPRLDLAYGQLLGKSGDTKESANVFRKLIKDFPGVPQADDARLALASLLTDGSLPETKDLPAAETLLAEVRKSGKGLPKGQAQIVELRLLASKSLWDEALNLVDRMDPTTKVAQPEVKSLWTEAWGNWVGLKLEKGFAGELLTRLKPGTFAALDAKTRLGVAELLAINGLLGSLPTLIAEAPAQERPILRKAALAKVQPEAQPAGVLKLLPAKGESSDEVLLRVRAEAAQEHWPQLRSALGRARPGPERIRSLVRLLQRPMGQEEAPGKRLKEAEGWLGRVSEKGEALEPLLILVADLRYQTGDTRGALALYPAKPVTAEHRGWVALMRAQALMRTGQHEAARSLIKEARDEPGFKGQRDALAKALGAY